MFDLGTMGELLIIALAVLVLIGPKEMPTVLRALGRWTQKLKYLTSNIRYEMTKHMQDGELEEYTRRINEGILQNHPDEPDASQTSTKPSQVRRSSKTSKKSSGEDV